MRCDCLSKSGNRRRCKGVAPKNRLEHDGSTGIGRTLAGSPEVKIETAGKTVQTLSVTCHPRSPLLWELHGWGQEVSHSVPFVPSGWSGLPQRIEGTNLIQTLVVLIPTAPTRTLQVLGFSLIKVRKTRSVRN